MTDTDALLAEVQHLNASVQPALAEQTLAELIQRMDWEELAQRQEEIQVVIDGFLPKRRRKLTATFRDRLTVQPKLEDSYSDGELPLQLASETVNSRDAISVSVGLPQTKRNPREDAERVDLLITRLQVDLAELSDQHIYQWATFYRDLLTEYFDVILDEVRYLQRPSPLLRSVRDSFAAHSREIFVKGYHFRRETAASEGADARIYKSLGGLQRFLDLPIEFYSAKLTGIKTAEFGAALRQVGSSMICGIIEGYCRAQLDEDGKKILPRFPRYWVHALPFLTPRDFAMVIASLESTRLVDGLLDSVKPVVEAIDAYDGKSERLIPLPAISQLVWTQRRLDITLDATSTLGHPRFIEIQCFLYVDVVSRQALEEAIARGIDIVVAPMLADLQVFVASAERFSDVVIPATSIAPGFPAAKQVKHRLDDVMSANLENDSPDRPLTFNFAKTFPLENPSAAKYFHVYRSSVRQLLQTFERRNGVRLWCSVRRSGKTTACAVDLDTTSGRSVVISQTCDDTGQLLGENTFYPAVCAALEAQRQLPADFVSSNILSSISSQRSIGDRVVFVLDEYETLFGRLRSALRTDPDLRYSVVQPLLNQLVVFTRENLLVFLGQQPNAHYILMDQNQLSAYVEQDAFPLFAHDPHSLRGEFGELLSKATRDRLDFDLDFANAVFDETAGHPYLTVNVLVELVDWLIQRRLPLRCVRLTADLFADFSEDCFSRAAISSRPSYDFFRAVASDGMSDVGRKSNPWLHIVYRCLRDLILENSGSCTLADFDLLCGRNIDPLTAFSSGEILTTASRANFLEVSDGMVRPKIRILARITASTGVKRNGGV